MYKGKARLVVLGFIYLLVMMLFGRGNSVSPEPGLPFSSQFQWHQANSHATSTIAIPTTATNPGPVINQSVHHDQGLGTLLSVSDLAKQEVVTGKQVVATVSQHLKKLGWQPLFSPTETGAYPQFVLYVTFQSGSYYCFVEYTATALDATQVSQQLDFYYS